MKRFSALFLLLVFFSCENADPILPEAPLCVEGEFRQLNPHCWALVDGVTREIFDLRIYGHSELDSINVPDVDLPEFLRVKGTRFYLQIDSAGVYGICNALFSNDVPYRISNVSTTLCGETANNF